jgi:hypothetical protein
MKSKDVVTTSAYAKVIKKIINNDYGPNKERANSAYRRAYEMCSAAIDERPDESYYYFYRARASSLLKNNRNALFDLDKAIIFSASRPEEEIKIILSARSRVLKLVRPAEIVTEKPIRLPLKKRPVEIVTEEPIRLPLKKRPVVSAARVKKGRSDYLDSILSAGPSERNLLENKPSKRAKLAEYQELGR